VLFEPAQEGDFLPEGQRIVFSFELTDLGRDALELHIFTADIQRADFYDEVLDLQDLCDQIRKCIPLK
jgi:hypothetical protein